MKSKRAQRVGLFFSVLETVGIILLVALAAITFGTRIPLLANLGINFFAVTSGSMEPTISTGSLIYVGKFLPEALKEGDIITYKKVSGENTTPTVITHRIIKVNKTEETQQTNSGEKKLVTYEFKTKGDANGQEDAYNVVLGEIIGLYKWHVPSLGYLTSFAQTPFGFATLVIVPAVILVMWEVLSLMLHFKQEYALKSEREIAKLRAELENKS
ncbi:MAG TPA: signal peptidase I [Vitreimonas sp.]|nr:signal peptidase I [Vitreimonas sp.]